METIRPPRGPGMSLSACLDQFLDNLASWSLFGLDNIEAKCKLVRIIEAKWKLLCPREDQV